MVVQDPQSGEFLPSLATSWDISPDGRTYTFHLRTDVRFHDGEPFDAEAVRANIDYTVNPENHSQKAVFMLGTLERVEVADPATVVFHMTAPYPPLLDSLSQVYLGMASPKALATWGPAEYQFHQVGTGPYRFVEYVPNDHITLARNPDYAWAPSIVDHSRASIELITFRFFTDPATRGLALENGDADIVGEIPPHEAGRLEATGNFELHPVPIPGQPLQFLFNTTRPPTDDLSVRLALLTAVDRSTIVNSVFGPTSPVAEGILSSSNWGASPSALFPGYSPAQADRLLRQAGWIPGEDGVRRRDGVPLRLHVVAPGWGNNPEVGQLIEAAWEEIGADVDLQIVASFGQLKEAQQAGDYHLIGINFFGTDPDLLQQTYASDGLYNWTGYRDPLLDELLRRAGSTSASQTDRRTIYAQVAQIVMNQVLTLPVRDYVDLVVTNRRVEGLRFTYSGWFPLLIDLEVVS